MTPPLVNPSPQGTGVGDLPNQVSSQEFFGTQSASVKVDTCLVGSDTPLVVLRCLPLIPHRTRAMFHWSMQTTPQAGNTSFVVSINGCDANGVIPVGGANIAFWTIEQQPVGTLDTHAGSWLYDPRLSFAPPDVDLGNGNGLFLGLHVTPLGGSVAATSSILQMIAGPIPSITIDNNSTSLLDGQGE